MFRLLMILTVTLAATPALAEPHDCGYQPSIQLDDGANRLFAVLNVLASGIRYNIETDKISLSDSDECFGTLLEDSLEEFILHPTWKNRVTALKRTTKIRESLNGNTGSPTMAQILDGLRQVESFISSYLTLKA